MNSAATASLWFGVVAFGIFHGLNPAMGWPLAVANGLGEKRDTAVFATWLPLGTGHLLAMALVLVPFAVLTWMLQWGQQIRLGAGLLVMAFGLSRLVLRHRHRWLARIRPSQVVLWSFLMATAHGAALMLLPILLGLCESPAAAGNVQSAPIDQGTAMALMRSSVGTAVMVSLVHTAAMIGAGLGAAWIVYRYLGLRALRASWLDLDVAWSLGLVASGAAGVATALLHP